MKQSSEADMTSTSSGEGTEKYSAPRRGRECLGAEKVKITAFIGLQNVLGKQPAVAPAVMHYRWWPRGDAASDFVG
jgi:hypothetical protein